MATDSLETFEEFAFLGQQNTSTFGYHVSKPFPLALQTKPCTNLTISDAVATISALTESGKIAKLVKAHGGALLVRGLPITTPDEYSQVVHGFGLAAHEEVGRPPHRTVLAKNVKTANGGPPELPIWPHNEYGWSTVHPAWLTFSALEVPQSGGATPIISSIGLAKRLEEEAPEFVQKLSKKGVRYLYRYGREELVSTVGATVFTAYGKELKPGDDEATIRKKVEREVRRHSERFKWNEDGSLSVTHVVPIIRKHLDTGLTTWFGNLTSAYGRSRHHDATQPPYLGNDGSYHPLPEYGDGEPIETEYLELALKIAESLQVDVHWQKGDVVLIDVGLIRFKYSLPLTISQNCAVMHSRRPWIGKRTVLAALWDEDGRIGDTAEGVEILKSSPREPITV